MNKSKVKRMIPERVISEIFERHSMGKAVSCTKLTGGEFNSVFKVKTEDENIYVIKVAPDKNTEVLTYEQGLIKSEVMVYELLQNTKTVHFPKIYGFNYSDKYGYKYLIMEHLDGDLLSSLRIGNTEYNKVMFELGKAMAEIHTVTSKNGYGYVQNGLKSTWKEAYLSMIDNIINDGLKKTSTIPYANRIKEIINKNSYVFDAVITPSLIHFDLWAGNIMIKDGELYALIDCERAMFGDIMGEFISLDYVAPFNREKYKSLIDGYNSNSIEKINFNKDELIRLYLMKIYLGLIAFVETYYRIPKLSPEFYGRHIFAKRILKNTLSKLEELGCSKMNNSF